MDVKKAFDHVSKSQLFKHMLQLGIDGDPIALTRSFLKEQKIQIVIDRHEI